MSGWRAARHMLEGAIIMLAWQALVFAVCVVIAKFF